MNCERARQLLMTDYLDGEATEALAKEVFMHLESCAQCRKLEEALRRQVSEPLRKAQKAGPPDFIWQNIREELLAQKAEEGGSVLAALKERLSFAFRIPKPVLATAMIALIIFSLFLIKPAVFRQEGNGEVEYLSYSDNGIEEIAQSGDEDLGTAIEIFLL